MNMLKPVLGEKFGCYEVVSEEVFKVKDKNREHYRGFFLVKCSCGRELLVRSDILKRGEATKCRYCSNKINYDKNVELNKIDHKGYSSGHQGVGEFPKTYLLHIKGAAIKRGLEWGEELTIDYLWNLFLFQDKKCALSRLDITLFEKGTLILTKQRNLDFSKFTASLDRKDSNIGYIRGNIQWIHRHINIMKNEFSEEYFKSLCLLVTNKNIINEQFMV